MIDACVLFNIYPRPVCRGMVNSVGESLFKILEISENSVTSGDICGMILGPDCSGGSSSHDDWSLDIPELDQVPPYVPPPVPDQPWNVSKILHLSDLHVHLNYSVGAASQCDYPICCMNHLDQVSDDEGAGYWGDYSCDLPPWTLDETLSHIRTNHPDLDMIILTGDLPAHDVWLQNQNYNLENIAVVASSLRKYFPHIPVLPAVGNHESYPVNMFPGRYEHSFNIP